MELVLLDPTFTAIDHRYSDHAGNVYPSVTQIITECWPIDTRFYPKSATERGTAVHVLAAAIDTGLMTLAQAIATAPDYALYLHAWTRFVEQEVDSFIWIEQKFIVPDRKAGPFDAGYAGTVDRIMVMRDRRHILGDLKTGREEKWHELQQGAYAVAAISANVVINGIASVYLQPSGKYVRKDNDLNVSIEAWNALLRWRSYRHQRSGR